jgi:hypothetical protein
MAVLAIQTDLTGVQAVTERYGLFGRVADIREFRRKEIPDCKYGNYATAERANK